MQLLSLLEDQPLGTYAYRLFYFLFLKVKNKFNIGTPPPPKTGHTPESEKSLIVQDPPLLAETVCDDNKVSW